MLEECSIDSFVVRLITSVLRVAYSSTRILCLNWIATDNCNVLSTLGRSYLGVISVINVSKFFRSFHHLKAGRMSVVALER